MSHKAKVVGNFYATQNEEAAFNQAVDIVPKTYSEHIFSL
jgi:hypothetical protein